MNRDEMQMLVRKLTELSNDRIYDGYVWLIPVHWFGLFGFN